MGVGMRRTARCSGALSCFNCIKPANFRSRVDDLPNYTQKASDGYREEYVGLVHLSRGACNLKYSTGPLIRKLLEESEADIYGFLRKF